MADCRKCKHNYKPSTCEPKCNRMCDGKSDFEPVTNAMRIRSMTDEELAEFLRGEKIRDELSLCADFGNGCYYYCKKNHACNDNIEQLYLEWLQSEAEKE